MLYLSAVTYARDRVNEEAGEKDTRRKKEGKGDRERETDVSTR